ncbi:3-hydroxyacyl-CoA dehydrogenase [uncultured Moraxella sp.]|uniref:3-hydroxyacyl-CoA dehydrogenase n=1 Tax=uncultured Moraxella sp. TaxID=263769 RepID=UPI0025D9DA89|nr:3-hydroxyacyl-CoA dehydrogenase [uncultured Moraxella sp.]
MTIKKVTILGAGVLGAQIAFQAAYAGFEVVSYDINDDALAAAAKRFETLQGVYQEQVGATTDQLSQTMARLSQSSDLIDAVGAADLIIEAVPENLDLKKQIWAQVGAAAPDHTIFLTNTSTLLPSSFADSTGAPERFLALHFANNIWVQNIVEVMGTTQTDAKYVSLTEQFAKDMGMDPVVLNKEQPRYIMNSLLVPLLDAASRLYANEVASPHQIDKVWKKATRSPKGPFEIMDIVGLRTVYAIHSANAERTGDALERQFTQKLKAEYIDQGKTGKESGQGFYDYDANGNAILDD